MNATVPAHFVAVGGVGSQATVSHGEVNAAQSAVCEIESSSVQFKMGGFVDQGSGLQKRGRGGESGINDEK